ncbi:MAG: putative rane protein [Acidobacteriota bacterium]
MPLTLSDLPLLNASLNATSGVLLLLGYTWIRRGRMRLHRAAMISACVVSTLFLTSYVIYHANVGSKPFPGRGPIRLVYFAILITHVILAAAVPPLALLTLTRGLRGRFDRHVAIARWTFPIWLYVSVTGVIVYLMLYRLY